MEVQDEGPGLPPQVAERLFAPCISSKKGGSGIGLAISRQLAKHLGAELDLKQSSSEGCAFRLVLPLQPQPNPSMKYTHSIIVTVLVLLTACFTPRSGSAQVWRWSNPTPHGNDILDMAWNGNLSVQVADSGQVYTSSGFYGWFPQNSGTTNTLLAVKFFGNRIVYAGANGTVGYSDDGVNFHASTLSTPDTGDWLVDLALSSSLVVAVGDNAIIYTSSDGANWHYQGKAPNNPNGDWLLSVAWGAGIFVTTGEGGYIATSSNGTNWTHRSSPVTDDLTHVAYISTTNPASLFPYTGFWAVSDDVSSRVRAIYSTNSGVNWYQYSLALSTNTLYAIAANPTTGLVAGNSEVQLGTSATSWQRQTLPTGSPTPAPVWPYYAALWDTTNLAYRLVGEDGMMVESTTTNGAYYWQEQYSQVPRDLLWQVALAADLYVAVGDNTRIMTSQNGIDWTIEAIPLTNSVLSPYSTNIFFCVGGTTNLFLAAGTRGCLAVSPNNPVAVVITNLDGTLSTNLVGSLGVIWYALPAPTTNDLAGVCVFSNRFYLAGANGTLLSSLNGTNWTRVSVPLSADLSGLAASSNMMVLTGDQGQILSSPNGSSWTQRASGTTNGLVRVRYLGGWFLAVGENGTILKSANGTSWSSVASGTTEWLNDAVMVSNACYIVGNNNTVLTSTNFSNWTNIGTITTRSLYGAATQNGQLLVVGLQGTILRAQIVPDLTPLTILSYGQSSGENVFVVAGNPDQEFTLDSSTNLTKWTTGPTLDLLYGSGTLTFLTQLGSNPPPKQFYRATLH
jgi:hypothetical protein